MYIYVLKEGIAVLMKMVARGPLSNVAVVHAGFMALVCVLMFVMVGGVQGGYRPAAGAVDSFSVSGGFHHHHHHLERMARRMESLSASLSPAANAPLPSSEASPTTSTSTSRVFHVTAYGADPTGSVDSTAAISKAISDACSPATARTLIPGVADLGGAEIHLDGGTYLIASPLTLPAGSGNIKIHSGTLVASEDFPTDGYLVQLWASHGSTSSSSSSTSSGYNYEYVTLRDLMLDANYRGGGVAIVDSLRISVDNCYIVHFMSDGIRVESGHETYIRNSFLGQHITAGNDPGEKNFSGTGINLMGNDNAVTDVVIFSAAIGILVSGQANTLTGVHCYNKASGWGGTGIYLKLPGLTQTRVVNCYLDYTGIVAEDPVQLHISSSFFLGDANVVLKSVNGVAKSVDIVDNIFSGGGKGVNIVELDESKGKFTDIDQVNVERNSVGGMTLRATSARASATGNGTVWAVDFSPVLLFPDRIGHVLYTLLADSAFPSHALRNVTGNRVVIESDVAVAAVVHVAVDQEV